MTPPLAYGDVQAGLILKPSRIPSVRRVKQPAGAPRPLKARRRLRVFASVRAAPGVSSRTGPIRAAAEVVPSVPKPVTKGAGLPTPVVLTVRAPPSRRACATRRAPAAGSVLYVVCVTGPAPVRPRSKVASPLPSFVVKGLPVGSRWVQVEGEISALTSRRLPGLVVVRRVIVVALTPVPVLEPDGQKVAARAGC